MKLSVHLITWNGVKYIPYLFESLRKQTSKDWFLSIIDNGSKDETVAAIKKELENFPVQYKFIENKDNIGFAPGHNQAFRDTDSEYFLLLNQDMYLAPDCLEKMVKFLNEHSDAVAVSPRLMKWDFMSICHSDRLPTQSGGVEESLENALRDPSTSLGMTNVIDALGLKMFRNRRAIEQFTGQEWNMDVILNEVKNPMNSGGSFAIAQDDKSEVEVFGVSGALPMYRRSMIQEVIFDDGTFFDESYHSYKEDVDLAYRLAARGFKSFVILNTTAYHDRSGAGAKEMGDMSAMANKQKQSELVKYHSYKNHLMTLYKNEYWQNLILDFPWILWYETKKLAYFLIFDRKVLAGIKAIWDDRMELNDKRKQAIKMRKVDWRVLRKWWK